MQRAIELGQQARYWSAPNPPVGCILVAVERAYGAGFTHPAGPAPAAVLARTPPGDAPGPRQRTEVVPVVVAHGRALAVEPVRPQHQVGLSTKSESESE